MIKIGVPYSGCEYESEIPATSEAEALAIAAGIKLGGGEPFVFMQDCGFLASLNVITGLIMAYDFIFNTDVHFIDKPEHHKYSAELAEKIINAYKKAYIRTDND